MSASDGGGHVPHRVLTLPAARSLWVLAMLFVALTAALASPSLPRIEGVPILPLGGAASLLCLTLAWLWPRRENVNRVLPLTAAAVTVTYAAVSVALDTPTVSAVRAAVAIAVQGTATLAFYRLRLGDNNLSPQRGRDLVDLMMASAVGAAAALLVGPLGAGPLDASAHQMLWWALVSACYTFIGGSCLMLLVQRHPAAESSTVRPIDVQLQLLAAAAALTLVITLPDLPLTWVALLPAIWAGATLGPWTSAAYCLTASLAVGVAEATGASTLLGGDYSLQRVGPFHLLMGGFTLVTLLLALIRDQRAQLASEVTRRRQEALDQAGLLSTVFESIKDALVLVDRNGTVRIHNAAADELLEARLHTEPAKWLRHEEAAEGFTYSVPRPGSQDGLQFLRVSLADVQYAGTAGVVAVVRDVTSEHERIEELSSFAAVAAHDLKSPLAAVQGWIEVAEDAMGADRAMVMEALDRSRSATTRMSREIDDWLTYSVAREGTVAPEPIDLQSRLDALVSNYPGADISVHTPDSVKADPTLFGHLMTNLIGNAIKYTATGVRPSIAVRSFPAGRSGWIRIYIVDNGIGIPEGEEVAVFEPFRRASTVTGTTYEGTGLGLALCKRIVRRHGGQISARRNSDRGTTISLTLPAA